MHDASEKARGLKASLAAVSVCAIVGDSMRSWLRAAKSVSEVRLVQGASFGHGVRCGC